MSVSVEGHGLFHEFLATLRSWVPVDYVTRLTHGLIREHTRWHPDPSTCTAVIGRSPLVPSVTATLGVSVPTLRLSPQTPRCMVGKHPLARLPSPRGSTAWLEQITPSLCTGASAMLHLCDLGCVAVVQPIFQNPFDVHHQRHVGVALHSSTASPLLSHDSFDVHHPLHVGVALHSSTTSSLSPKLTAVVSTKNVRWIGHIAR